MSRPTKITDHVLQVVGNLLWQYRDSPKLVELVSIFAIEIQDLEDLYDDLFDKRYLDGAEGVQLDNYGKIVGWSRQGLSDDDFRKLIKVGIATNQTDGQVDEITYIISRLIDFDGDEPIRYTQRGRAHYSLDWIVNPPTNPDWLRIIETVMDKITPSGVSWETTEGTDQTQVVFQFDTTNAGYDQGGFAQRTEDIS